MQPVGLIPEARPQWAAAKEESQAGSPGVREGRKEGGAGGHLEGLVLSLVSLP